MKSKVVILTNIITPYRIILFNSLNKMKGIKFNIITLSKREENREWLLAKEKIRFDYQVLPGLHTFIWSKNLPIHLNWGLWQNLRRYNPDLVIISGYANLAYLEAVLYCKIFKKKCILWSGTTLLSAKKTNGLIGKIKKIIIKAADRYIAYGTKAEEFLEYMGAKEEHIHIGFNTVDMQWFREKTEEIRKEKSFIDKRAKYPEFLMLYVGRLVQGKGIKQILEAIPKLSDSHIGLLIVGSGPQEEELKELCATHNINNVYFEGFKQKDRLPYYYALADLLIFPTFREIWGLVVNEALASGLYALVSNRAGASYDLIKEGWNGDLFDPYDVEKLAFLIKTTKYQIKKIRLRRNKISRHACRKFDIGLCVKTFLETIASLDVGI